MSKIICDICGTTYQDTAPCCPICGCTRDAAASLLGDELLGEEIMDEPRGRGGHFTASKKKKEIFDFDEVNTRQSAPPREDEDDLGEEPEYDEGPQHNTAAVILLTALIAVLLLAAGYLVVRYFLPGRGNDANTPASETQTMSSEETTNSVPCTNLVLMSGEAKLYSNGAQYLINVAPQPADTTDKLIYRSADESVATVDENGMITAMGEGTTEIYILCGTQEVRCPVTCSFEPETEATEAPTETQAVPAETDENGETVATEAAAEGETTDGTEATDASAETTEATKAPTDSDVKLKLKKSDIMLGIGYEFQLLLDCKLEQNAVEWSSEHPDIVSVDEEGNVKALRYGTTSVTAKYGDQEVSCIVRCR